MNLWQILGTLIEAIVLIEVLPGKDVTTPDGAILGTATDIELDLMRNKTWVIVEHRGQWSRIPSEQINSLTHKMTLPEGLMSACMEKENGTLV